MEEIKYGVIVKKSVLWSLTSLFTLFLLVISIWCFASPSSLGNKCFSLGLNNMSIKLQYADYQRSGDINSLATLAHRSIAHGKRSDAAEYSKMMIDHKHFIDYCKAFDSEYSGLSSEYDYITGNYIKMVYTTQTGADVFALARQYYENSYNINTYTAVNPLACFAKSYIADANRLYSKNILTYFDEIYTQLTDNNALSSEVKNLCRDAYYIAVAFGDSDAKTEWWSKYEKN